MLEEEDFDPGDGAWSGGGDRQSSYSYGAVGSLNSTLHLAHLNPEGYIPPPRPQTSSTMSGSGNFVTIPPTNPTPEAEPRLVDVERPPAIPPLYTPEPPEHPENAERQGLLDMDVAGHADSFRDEVLAYDDPHSRGDSITSTTSAAPLLSPVDDMGRIKGSLVVRNV